MITNERQEINREIYDYHIALPNTSDILAPFTAAIAMQLLSYYTSVHRDSNVDQPRNLAKAVTVE